MIIEMHCTLGFVYLRDLVIMLVDYASEASDGVRSAATAASSASSRGTKSSG